MDYEFYDGVMEALNTYGGDAASDDDVKDAIVEADKDLKHYTDEHLDFLLRTFRLAEYMIKEAIAIRNAYPDFA